MLYQVGFQASLLCQESHIYRADYVMQTSNCIANYFPHDNKSLLIDNPVIIICVKRNKIIGVLLLLVFISAGNKWMVCIGMFSNEPVLAKYVLITYSNKEKYKMQPIIY